LEQFAASTLPPMAACLPASMETAGFAILYAMELFFNMMLMSISEI
jgi:hypothetical protein